MNIYMYRIFKHIDTYVSMRACVQQYIHTYMRVVDGGRTQIRKT